MLPRKTTLLIMPAMIMKLTMIIRPTNDCQILVQASSTFLGSPEAEI